MITEAFNALPTPAAWTTKELTVTRTPNIRNIDPHEACRRQAENPDDWGRPGDVRRCPHGHVQVMEEPHVNSSLQGPGMRWWRTLHPFWDWRTYRRATEALQAAEDF